MHFQSKNFYQDICLLYIVFMNEIKYQLLERFIVYTLVYSAHTEI
jgi:hypothetical protein